MREFLPEYLEDKYFVKTQDKIEGKSIVSRAIELGFKNTCNCSAKNENTNKREENLDDKDKRIDPYKLKVSGDAINFIKSWEDFKPNLYNDDSKERHCTIGYGHLVHRGPCDGSESVEFKNGITKERALELFHERLPSFENAVRRDVTVPLYQYEFDALVSLLFNCGENFFVQRKAPNLHKNLLIKEYESAANEFLDITNGGLKGLVKRRKAENNMFLNNIYDSTLKNENHHNLKINIINSCINKLQGSKKREHPA